MSWLSYDVPTSGEKELPTTVKSDEELAKYTVVYLVCQLWQFCSLLWYSALIFPRATSHRSMST